MSESIEELLKSGQTLLNTGNPKEAMTMYDKVLEISSNHIDALIKKGNILGKLGKYENAIIYYDRVLEKENQNILAYSIRVLHIITLINTKQRWIAMSKF